MTTVLDAFGFVTVIVLLLSGVVYRPRGDDDFLVADRRLSLFPLVATLVMTEFNTSTLLAFSAAGYRAGPMALALPLVFLVGLLFYTLTVARAWKRFDRLSVAELFAVRYSPALGRLASVLLLASMTGFSATYVKSLALLFSPFVPWMPPAVASALLTAGRARGGAARRAWSPSCAVMSSASCSRWCWCRCCWWSACGRPRAARRPARGFDASQLRVDPVAQW